MLSDWERANLSTLALNGELWKKCRLRQQLLIDWIDNLPEAV